MCCTTPAADAISAYAALRTELKGDGGIAGGCTAADIPARILTAYKKAARQTGTYAPACRGMRRPVLAKIANAESHHAADRTIADHSDIRPKIYGVLLNRHGHGREVQRQADRLHELRAQWQTEDGEDA
ncbi:hypothetical protein FNH09_43970 [Streptomyces adustus]|uniref:Uncharacterized protein n=1 Tax=Streptomyces adustus TaxID=1609272 RepID=A0A5N8VV09_9ACTN|nr:hypothetical protein [Streptomyces adustus]MPY37924.1 hypothetical protein [Streptomyces adustus]